MNLLIIMFCGLVASFSMIVFMGLINGLGIAHADMIRAIGSIYTHNYKNAFWPGLAIKLFGGICFAIFYAIFAGVVPTETPISLILMMTGFGTFHGLAVGVILFIEVAEHHPLAEFRRANPSVIFSHIAGHIVYGFVLGVFFAVTHVNLNLLSLRT